MHAEPNTTVDVEALLKGLTQVDSAKIHPLNREVCLPLKYQWQSQH